MGQIAIAKSDSFPQSVGYAAIAPTLCVGLDIAWHGGSKNDRTSQYDFVVATVLGSQSAVPQIDSRRVALFNRDPTGAQTADAIEALVAKYQGDVERIVVAIDAPLQASPSAPPPKKVRAFRECERELNRCRKAIDKAVGGSGGWHPNVQPGIPLASRVTQFAASVCASLNFVPWTANTAQATRLLVECFPAEAVWAAKRLDNYPEYLTAPVVKAYKAQGGALLSATQVRQLVETVLLDGFKRPSGKPDLWPRLVENLLQEILADTKWMRNRLFRGGKMLDDVVDSCICLATAVSYAAGNAHAWIHPGAPADGHIIGPGRFA